MSEELELTSLQNPRVKQMVKLKKRHQRDELNLLVVEGYRELMRYLDHGGVPHEVYYAPDWFLGDNEPALLDRCRAAGAACIACSKEVFQKMSYRDRPEGLLASCPQVRWELADIQLSPTPLLLICEQIEKPGNLGTMLRSADAVNADAVIVCDRGTDINNPNVVRASIGTLFTRPVVEEDNTAVLAWLREKKIKTLAATPHTDQLYTQADMSRPTAVIMGTEKFGLSEFWMEHADQQVMLPMLGQCDSLNVASAATLLLYEAIRQRAGFKDDE